MTSVEKLREGLRQTEYDGLLFLDNKAQLVEADRERNGLREAARALKNQEGMQVPKSDGTSSGASTLWPGTRDDGMVWLMQPGGVALQLSREAAADNISKRQKHQERCVNDLRKEQKFLTSQLADKGGVTSVGDGVLNAMLNLKDDGR